ncbi:MAG: MarR family transcriptional regulator, partial [Lachnospiraceae bacterium]|nr:MarR family transcriptional regulator [Lachnospiraceae bacterium]
PYLKPLGLTYTQYVVFMVLWEKESVNVGQLGSILHLDAGTLTPLLKTLEKEGYVTRERSNEDERVTIVTITKKGNDLKKKCKDIPLELARQGSPLTEKEAKELYRLLYKYLER